MVRLSLRRQADAPASARPSRRHTLALTVITPLALAAAACSGGTSTTASSSSSSSDGGGAITVTADNGSITLNHTPEHIVSLSPSHTEMLFAVGAGAQVAAVDDQSNYPTNAPRQPGLSGFTPSVETIVNLKPKPDLVVLSYNPPVPAGNDYKAGSLSSVLNSKNIPVLYLNAPKNLDGAYQQWRIIGTVTGHGDDAAKLVTDAKVRIADAVATAPSAAKGKKLYAGDADYYSADSNTFIGDIYQQFGLVNIADAAPKSDTTAPGYPQLSAEFIASQAPDYFVTTSTDASNKLAAVSAFSATPAVKNKAIITLDADQALRWGPRVVDLAESFSKKLANPNAQ